MDKISEILKDLGQIKQLLKILLKKAGESEESVAKLLEEPVTPPGKPGQPGG